MAFNHLQVCWSLMGRFADGHAAGLAEQAIVQRHRLGGTRNIYLDLNLSISALLLGRYAESIAALARAEKAGVLDQATLHLRRASLALQLGQGARCVAELAPLLDGRVPALAAVRFNANLIQLRWLLSHAGAMTAQRQAALQQALHNADALAAQTGRMDHAARLLLMRGRVAEASQRLPALQQALERAQAHTMRSVQVTALAWMALALHEQGQPAQAQERIEAALALRDAGYVADQMPGVELDAIAVDVLSMHASERAAQVLSQAVAWIHHTAATEVPEAYRHGFLNLHPVHTRLLMRAGKTAHPAGQSAA
jgi:hypothetical protein